MCLNDAQLILSISLYMRQYTKDQMVYRRQEIGVYYIIAHWHFLVQNNVKTQAVTTAHSLVWKSSSPVWYIIPTQTWLWNGDRSLEEDRVLSSILRTERDFDPRSERMRLLSGTFWEIQGKTQTTEAWNPEPRTLWRGLVIYKPNGLWVI